MKERLGRRLRIRPLALVLALASIGFALAPSATNESVAFSQRSRPFLAQQVSEKGHPKMESVLSHLQARHAQAGLVRTKEFADERGIALGPETVRLVIETTPGETDAAIRAAEALGATLETSHERFVQMTAPVPLLSRLADLPEVSFVRQPYRARLAKLAAPAVVSEGVASIGADGWHKAGIKGKGVKIGLVDLGFYGYQSLLGTELPAKVTARSFRIGKDISGQKEPHGTSLAEIVYDVAPEADLYLANFETDVEFANAVSWFIVNKVDMISCSIGWFGAGPQDGTGPIDDVVTNARENYGILWFNSAGNEAETHWAGKWVDLEGDGYLNFAGGSNFNSVYAAGGTFISVVLSWDDPWGASDNDLDMYLYDNNYREVANSLNWQRGKENPTEGINFFVTTTGFYHVAIKKYDAKRDVKFSLFSVEYDLRYKVPEGSITIPADAKAAVAVGATRYSNDKLESFSSQGPTLDGRTKPDITAPDGVSTATYGAGNFFGTSASAPHAVGAAALLKCANPTWDADRIQVQLESSAKHLGNYGKNSQYGSGRLNLGSPPTSPVGTGTPTPVTSKTPMPTPSGTVSPTATPGPGTPTAVPTATPQPGTPTATATAAPTATATAAPTATPAPKVNMLFLPSFIFNR